MAFFSSQDGSLYIDGQRAAKVVNWTVSVSADSLDTTTLEDTDRTAIYGLRSASGSCRLYYYQSAPGDQTQNAGHAMLNKLIKRVNQSGAPGVAPSSQEVEFRMNLNDGAGNRSLTYKALITSVSMSMAIGEVLAVDVNWSAVGAPTEVSV